MSFKRIMLAVFLLGAVLLPQKVNAMHIMEGFLSVKWAIFWWVIAIPFIIYGLKSISKITEKNPNFKLLMGVVGAFAFVVSSMKIPSITGSSSHLTGVGLGTILFGPSTMVIIGAIVLLFQALLLAHGGITTLGANIFSMAIAGPIVSFLVFYIIKRNFQNVKLAVFFAAFLGDLVTYVVTSLQLALAFPQEVGGVIGSFAKFAGVFAFTQFPLAIVEGLLTVVIYNLLVAYNKEELSILEANRKEGFLWRQ